MNFKVWYSTESFADYIIDKTDLSKHTITKEKLYESDANNPKNFYKMPDHIRKILYLDAPDLIVEMGGEPIFLLKFHQKLELGIMLFKDLQELPHLLRIMFLLFIYILKLF